MEATAPEAFPIERVFAQFETEEQAITFEQTLLAGEAMLVPPFAEDGDDPHNDADYFATDGLCRLAVMDDDGVSAWGFKKKTLILRQWMKAQNFGKSSTRRCLRRAATQQSVVSGWPNLA